MKKVNKILIVGAGLGGQSVAIALKKQGFDIHLIEIQKEFDVYGVGIIQQMNALRALDAIGVATEAMRLGSPYGQVKMCLPHGPQIGLVGPPPIGKYPSHNGISRKILHEVLYKEAQSLGINYQMGLTVDSLSETGNSVEVSFSDGSKGNYDLIVAADGVNSKIRNMVFGLQKPEYVGLSVWRYAFPRHEDLDTGYMFFGKKSKIGFIPMTEDTMYMFVVTTEGADNPIIPEHEKAERLRAYLDEYPVKIAQDAKAQITDNNLVNYRPLEKSHLAAPWYKGRVVILGDAAHATIPQLGSGAALAIEDAVVLAEELASNEDYTIALENYMKRRYERCMFIVKASETLGEWELLGFEGKPLPEGANAGELMGKAVGSLMAPI